MSEAPRRVHFVAIGGTGTGSLAGLLRARGITVTGSDANLYPPMSDALRSWGIQAHEGYRAEQVLEAEPDLVVIGNAVRPDNPEARAAIDEGLPYRSFSDALYELAIAGRHSVVVSGTHGKTTTTSILAYLLHATGRDPSFLVGGYSLDFDGSFHEGQGKHFVVEGDEYDTAFFDKTPKFLHYHPLTLVLTSVEFDHADIYRDLDHVKRAFRTLIAAMPADGTIVAALDHEHVRDVLGSAPCAVIGYGLEARPGTDWRAARLEADGEGTQFELIRPDREALRVRVPFFGAVNIENALAALAAVDSLGVTPEEAGPTLPRYRGVKRRQEVRGEVRGVLVIDDFAHHPTAVEATLAAIRSRFPQRRLVAVFEPRTNTSRRAIFQERYAQAFGDADRVVVRSVEDTPIYSATGDVTERFSAEQLVEALEARGTPALVRERVDELVDELLSSVAPGDVIVVMSNGGFDGLHEKLLAGLQSNAKNL